VNPIKVCPKRFPIDADFQPHQRIAHFGELRGAFFNIK
jgi:hypothetical protein